MKKTNKVINILKQHIEDIVPKRILESGLGLEDINVEHLKFIVENGILTSENVLDMDRFLSNIAEFDDYGDLADAWLEHAWQIPEGLKRCLDYEKYGKMVCGKYVSKRLDNGTILIYNPPTIRA